MMKGFRISKLISSGSSDYRRHHQFLCQTGHHVDSPLILRLLSSSSYNNRSNDGYGACSYVPFDDDEQKPGLSPSLRVNDNKIQDVDGFLDRFKLGFDQEKNKPNSDKLDSGRGTGEGQVEAEEPPKLDADEYFRKKILEPVLPDLGSDELVQEEMKLYGLMFERRSIPEGQVEAEEPPPPEDADEIFRKTIPNAAPMLRRLCSEGLVQEAVKLFGLMRERGSIPVVVTYTEVVEGFCRSHKLDEAKRVFRKMQNNGIEPYAFSYDVLVQALFKGKRLDDALEFCLEMVVAGLSPNMATFAGLVVAFCVERGPEAAQIMISNLKEKGFCFDEEAMGVHLDENFMHRKPPFSPFFSEAIFGKKALSRYGYHGSKPKMESIDR